MLRKFARKMRVARSHIALLLIASGGGAAIEFAIIAPVLFAIGLGMMKFGLAMQNYLLVTNAAAQGALTLALARGTTNPYTSTTTAVTNSAPSLASANVTTTVKINGTACTTDSGCASSLTAGATVTVKVSYPCDLTVMGVNYKPSCTVSSQSAQMVQ